MRCKTFTLICCKFIQDNRTKLHQNRPSFVVDMTQTFGIHFARTRCIALNRWQYKE